MDLRVSTIPLIVLLLWTVSACGTRATGPFFQRLEAKEEAVGIIYLYAQQQIFPTFTQYPIKANGVSVVKLVDGGYYPFRVAPGVVTFEVETFGSKPESIPLTLQVEGGHTYFVRPRYWNVRSPYARVELDLLTEEEGINEISSCRLILEPSALKSP
jgi:hypothetical protein